jgi:hypothetical protein
MSVDRFTKAIEQFPRLSAFYNIEEQTLAIDNMLASGLSSGEAILAKFFAEVWTREDHGFRIIDVGSLSEDAVEIIGEWIAEPYWP